MGSIKESAGRRKLATGLLGKVKKGTRLVMESPVSVIQVTKSSVGRGYTVGRKAADGTFKAVNATPREAAAWIFSSLEDGAEAVFSADT